MERWLKYDRKRKTRAKANQKKKKNPIERPGWLTDKQRSAFAHAHYILHYGTKAEAAHFLKHHRLAASISDTIRSSLQQKCSNFEKRPTVGGRGRGERKRWEGEDEASVRGGRERTRRAQDESEDE